MIDMFKIDNKSIIFDVSVDEHQNYHEYYEYYPFYKENKIVN